MALINRKVNEWEKPIVSLEDKPKLTAAELKAAFDSNANQLKNVINGIIDDLTGSEGAANIGTAAIEGIGGTTVQVVLQLLADKISKVDPYLGQPVAISQGGTGAKTAQDALYKLGARSNGNLLINSDFSVNQRGKSSYIGAWTYGFDMWMTSSNTTISKNSSGDIVITNNSPDSKAYVLQRLEKPVFDRYLTLSLLTTDGIYSTTGKMQSGDKKSILSVTPFGQISIEYSELQYVAITLNSSQSVTLPASIGSVIKLEYGKNQTLARQKEDGLWELLEKPDYSAELEKCQRFLLAMSNNSGIGYGYDAETAYIFVSIPTAMAKVPVYINNNTTEALYPTDGNNVNSIAVISQNNPPANIVALTYRGKNFVPARPYSAYMMNGLLSAEL